ncbi:MAG: Ig-like domain-containing protein, partial [Thiopseudomonas sp.]
MFWDDLRTDVSGQTPGKIHYETIGEAPNRQLVVQWTNMYFYGSNLPMGTFQAVLSEGSNTIQFQYRYLTDERSLGNSATIGLKGTSGAGQQIGCNQGGAIGPEQAILFTPTESGEYAIDQDAPYSFVDISGLTPSPPAPEATYTNTEPTWTWQKISSLNSYEIQIQTLGGEVLHSQTLGDVNSYSYADGLLDGGTYVARVRGSINNGGTWEMWSGLSSATTVDLTEPTAEISKVIQRGATDLDVHYKAQDERSGLYKLHMRAATDHAFNDTFFDQDLSAPGPGSRTLGLPAGITQVFIEIQAFDMAGNASIANSFVFNVLSRPVIQMPVAGSIVERLPVNVMGTAYPDTQVSLYLNNKKSGNTRTTADGQFQFDNIPLRNKGTYALYVTSELEGSTSEDSERIEFQFVPAPPAATLSFAGTPLLSGASITQAGILAINAESQIGIARIQASLNGTQIFNQTYGNVSPVTASQFVDFVQVPNGSHTLVVVITDADGNSTTLTIPFVLQISAPPAPTIIAPVDGTILSVPTVNVSGSAAAGSQVQLYVDGAAAGNPLTASTNGSFAASLTLEEGEHQLTARASNQRGQSDPGAAVRVTYTASVPTVAFVSPAEDATLSADSVIEVSAVDAGGITGVRLYANDTLLETLTKAPWQITWKLKDVADGNHTLKAIATNTTGKTAQATRAVTVQKNIPAPPLPPSPYSVRNVSVTPAISFGHTPIQISGEVVSHPESEPVASATLRMVLRVQGFERRLNLVGDANGRFNYTFTPQASDAGSYEVRIVHPDDAAYASREADGRFTINRLSANYSQYTLNAIRGIASSAVVNVKASVGTGATGVHWKALPADQPSGSLPP